MLILAAVDRFARRFGRGPLFSEIASILEAPYAGLYRQCRIMHRDGLLEWETAPRGEARRVQLGSVALTPAGRVVLDGGER